MKTQRSRLDARLVAAALAVSGCQNPVAAVGFERMVDQPRGKPFKASPYFADGRLMRSPPAGVVAANGVSASRQVRTGLDGEAYVRVSPVRVDRPLLDRGRGRFNVYCAACHGLTGDGVSVVATHMSLRKPPSLVAEPVRSFPPGRVFQVMSEGYGLMPAYGAELSFDERWAVVAYVRALGLSAGAALERLPEDVRRRAEEALP